jgi:hypothetical protein
MSSDNSTLLPTQAAAATLGLNRQQFLSVIRFLGVKPICKQKLGQASRTPANFYSQKQLQSLQALATKTQALGLEPTTTDFL